MLALLVPGLRMGGGEPAAVAPVYVVATVLLSYTAATGVLLSESNPQAVQLSQSYPALVRVSDITITSGSALPASSTFFFDIGPDLLGG